MYDSDLVYLLDLSIFAYQLHAQTLVWPMDPYYEQMNSWLRRRKTFMGNVHSEFYNEISTSRTVRGFEHFDHKELHGPGNFEGKTGRLNKDLDPIISQYSRIYPWRPCFTRSKPGQWIFYKTPWEISDRIKTVKVSRYVRGQGYYQQNPNVVVETLYANRPQEIQSTITASDSLYCFEGGTGNIGASSGKKADETPAVWSIMGFVLADRRGDRDDNYDVYIAFRGSRSGRAGREIAKKISPMKIGNPDWKTDLDSTNHRTQQDEINPEGLARRGFVTSVKTMFPTILECLKDIDNERGKPPKTITVTGHSLGGALAVNFTSAMTCGKFGFDRNSNTVKLKTDNPLPNWLWREIKLVTFGTPLVGNGEFVDSLAWIDSRHCLLKGDPITLTVKEAIGNHVGRKISISANVSGFDLHETYHTRRNLISYLKKTGAVSFQNIPANSGSEEDLEPYKQFTNLQETFDLFKKITPDFAPADLLPDFSGYLGLYLGMLSLGFAEKPPNFHKMIRDLQRVNNPVPDSEEDILEFFFFILRSHKETILEHFDQDMYYFLGIYLYLALVQKENRWLPIPDEIKGHLK